MTRRRQRWQSSAAPVLATHFTQDPRALDDMSPEEHNFREDVVSGITPYFIYSERPDLTAELTGDHAIVGPILQDLGDDHARDLTEQLCSAVSEVARVVSWSGRAVFEICRDEQGAVRLVTIPSRGLWALPGYCIQVIPKRDRERLQKRFNIVRTRKLWIVKMPRTLGGRRGYAAVLRRLRSASFIGPGFFRRDFANYMQSGSVYNFRTYRDALNVFQEVITRRWHWDRRDTSMEQTTDMYYMFKKFGFRAAQCVLRDHIIDEINRLFQVLGVAATVSLKDASSSADFLAAREKFMAGEMSFKEALAFCRR